MKKLLRDLNRSAFMLMVSGFLFSATSVRANIIEEQLAEIGTVPDEEIVVVQRKYTRKNSRLELTPVMFGGVPFGTIRRTLFGGASATFHFNDWLAIEAPGFVYTKTFFSSFTKDINVEQKAAGKASINIDEQRLLYFLTAGLQVTPFYGKLATFSEYIAYIEPFFTLGAGLAKTESSGYLTIFPGVGFRLFFKEWFSMRFDFRDYIYREASTNRVTGADESKLRNNYAFTVSLSFWLPKMPSN